MFLNEEVQNKWKAVLDHESLSPIKDTHRRSVTAVLLENTEKESAAQRGWAPQSLLEAGPANQMGASSSTASDGAIDTYDPVLISLVRRAAPNLIAYDLCGVQPMTGPTGLIFAMRSRYANQVGTEAFYNEANTEFASVGYNGSVAAPGSQQVGTAPGTQTGYLGSAGDGLASAYNYAQGMSTAQAEQLGDVANAAFAEMAFSIEKVTVTAKSRALKAEYTMELAQDLKAIHGLDAETELAKSSAPRSWPKSTAK